METVDDYRDRILSGIHVLDPLELPLSSAHGCVLAKDVAAPWPLPSFDNSSMDGYAVRAADVASATDESPVTLTVIDDVPAGYRATEAVREGTAVRIMTGAPMPDGADAVVPVERTDGGTDTVSITASVDAGAYIRRAAEDVASGDIVLSAGTLIGARQVAILAAVGCGLVYVHPRPRVAVISTGSELVEPGLPLRHGLISDSNSYLLVAACKEAGADAYRVGPIVDDDRQFLAAVEDQLHRCDLILTSGGVSMGAYDTVKAVLSQLGSVEFTKVAMQPGMPQGHGYVGEEEVPIITLPGNPVSSYVSFENFVRPAIRRMRGLSQLHRPVRAETCTVTLSSPAGKRQFARGRFLPGGGVSPVGAGQGSHVLGGLAVSDALIVVPEDTTTVNAGDNVTVIDLRDE
ncbi:MAG: molybdopterin molybdenumtransferase MoeA [Actinomycetales bacterium]|nr:molybdopterin molybdenumtransferase MoeA [Actinomycetales bacterium]